MANWQLLLLWAIVVFGFAIISFIFHLKTPEKKRSKGIIHPFSFMLLVAMAVLFKAYILYLFDI